MISQKQIDEIVNKIVEGYQPEKIMLFGSYAHNKQNEDSDLDLFIIKDTEKPFFERLRNVRRLLAKTKLPYDILVYTNKEYNEKKQWINHIAYIVSKEGKVVYGR